MSVRGIKVAFSKVGPGGLRSRPRVSFLIAAHNEERFLSECVESCLRQQGVEVEVCVVDDGSTDTTWACIEELKGKGNVKAFRFRKNLGKVAAFNKAYELATGEYFLLMGADDVVPDYRAKLSIESLEGDHKSLAYGDYYICDSALTPLRVKRVAASVSLEDLAFNNKISGGTMCLKKDLSAKVFPIPESLAFEDWWIAFHAVAEDRAVKIDVPLLYYRFHSGNTSGAYARVRGYKRRDFERHEKYYEELLGLVARRWPFRERLHRRLVEARLFKRTYIAHSLKERWTGVRRHVNEEGIPCTIPGFLAALLLMPGMGVLMDFFLSRRAG